MRNHSTPLFWLFLGVLIFSLGKVAVAVQPDPGSRVEFYIDTYGGLDSNTTPLAQRAEAIFERLLRVAEDPVGLTPGLKLINSDGAPWAIALPDGYIVLTRAALEICYQGVSQETGDARLAFVIGHELAHLTSHDFWHREIYLSLSGESNNHSLKRIQKVIAAAAGIEDGGDWREAVKRKELQADDGGFLYASLAGYRTDKILTEGDDNFFDHWIRQTRSYRDELHLGPTERTAFLRARFSAITDKTRLFKAGLQLAYFGRLEDAATLFESFRNSFPAHEALNNLGYVHLELARKYLPTTNRTRFWLPTVLDNAPKLLSRSMNGESGIPRIAKNHLHRAIKYLDKAVLAHRSHLPSRLNLATANFLLGQYNQARVAIDEARTIDPNSTEVAMLRALILYEQEKEIDMWPTVVGLLQGLQASNDPRVTYNLARLYEERGRKVEAATYWKLLLSETLTIKEAYWRASCQQVHGKTHCDRHPRKGVVIASPVSVPIPLGSNINDAAIIKPIRKWSHHRQSIGSLILALHTSLQGDELLAIDEVVALATIRNLSFHTTQELVELAGFPDAKYTLGDQFLWSYPGQWAALVEGDTVKEIWIQGGSQP